MIKSGPVKPQALEKQCVKRDGWNITFVFVLIRGELHSSVLQQLHLGWNVAEFERNI